VAKADKIKNIKVFRGKLTGFCHSRALKTIPPAKSATTIVRKKVAKLELIPITPILPKMAVNPAKNAEPSAK
jgi:hypothetical protein